MGKGILPGDLIPLYKTYKIPKDAILIEDDKKPIAIGGIIGGLNSAISESSQNILLESAFFDPLLIRKTSHLLALRTESSIRFEKETDPNMTIFALDRAASLIQSICGGEIAKGVLDVKEKSFAPLKVTCRFQKVNDISVFRIHIVGGLHNGH